MKTYTRAALAAVLVLSLGGSLAACNMSTNEDAQRAMQEASESSKKAGDGESSTAPDADEDLSYADMSEEDFASQAAQTVEEFIHTNFDPSTVKTIDKLPDEEKELLKRANTVANVGKLSDEEKEELVEVADKVYNMRHFIAGVDDMSDEDRGALIVGLNYNLDGIWRFFGGRGALKVKAHPEKAEVDSARTMVKFPVGSIDMDLSGIESGQKEPLAVVVDGGQLRIHGQYLIDMAHEVKDGTVTRTHSKNGVTTTEQEKITLFEK